MKRAGFTLLEMLVVIAIIGIFTALGVPMLRPPSSYLFANDVKAIVQQGRYEAIKRNTPVAVVWNIASSSYTTRFDETNTTFSSFSTLCTGTASTIKTLNTKQASDYRSISVSTPFTDNGLVWMPTGRAKACNGGAISNGTVTINDNRKPHYVIVSSAGRVRVSATAP